MIEINGLLWDEENYVSKDKKRSLFTFSGALRIAKKENKRLPTKEEYEKLLALGWHGSETDKGIWLANDKLFFPASGCRYYDSDSLRNSGIGGYTWTSTPNSDGAYNLFFYIWNLGSYSEGAYTITSNPANRFSIRLVKDFITI